MSSKELTKEKLLSSKFQYAIHDVQVEKARNNLPELHKKAKLPPPPPKKNKIK